MHISSKRTLFTSIKYTSLTNEVSKLFRKASKSFIAEATWIGWTGANYLCKQSFSQGAELTGTECQSPEASQHLIGCTDHISVASSKLAREFIYSTSAFKPSHANRIVFDFPGSREGALVTQWKWHIYGIKIPWCNNRIQSRLCIDIIHMRFILVAEMTPLWHERNEM